MRYLFLLWYCLVKYFNIIIQFLLKISLIWWDKFICNNCNIFINESCFIKTIVIIVGKLTKNRVLWGGAVVCEAPRSRDRARKFSPSCGAGWGWGKTKPCEVRVKTPSFGPTLPHWHPYLYWYTFWSYVMTSCAPIALGRHVLSVLHSYFPYILWLWLILFIHVSFSLILNT